MRIHLVSAGFRTANGQGFLAPILRLRRRLREGGCDVGVLPAYDDAAADCDVVGFDSAFLRAGWDDGSSIRLLERAARANPRLAYFDIQDSTGTLQTAALDCVALYFKSQLLRDRAKYAEPHYGGRLYTDFYHRNFGIEDAQPQHSAPVTDPEKRSKLRVSWHSGFAEYGIGGLVRREAYARVKLPALLRRPTGCVDPRASRTIGLGTRMTHSYSRATVAFQRTEAARRLDIGLQARLSRRAFMQELARTKAVLSPFGWGEINLRDYEACIAGAAMIKPDMGHLETWPDLYRADSYIPFRWDFSDLKDQTERAIADDEWRTAIAARAQSVYRRAVASDQGDTEFCNRFDSLMRAVTARSSEARDLRLPALS
jgi:hypothetical protein